MKQTSVFSQTRGATLNSFERLKLEGGDFAVMSDSDDDAPQLSTHAMAALQDFYQEQKSQEDNMAEAMSGDVDKFKPDENWQLSQFWYDESTAQRLAAEALSAAGDKGRIACISAPTAYKKIRELKGEGVEAYCLEFDERFRVYGEDFIPYDYNDPLKLPPQLEKSCDVVLADPPFLSEECLCKTALTVQFLARDKVLLCTGAVMTGLAGRLLGVKPTPFLPKHANGLQNEFRCFANYTTDLLNKPH